MDGGLGIRKITKQNKAGMAQLVWQFLIQENAWWANVLSQKYLTQNCLAECTPKRSDSKTWKAILRHKSIILDHQKWVIGTSTAVRAP